MREARERGYIKISRGGFLFLSSFFLQCEKFCCVQKMNNLKNFLQSARSVSMPVLFCCGFTNGWELELLKLVFLFQWCSCCATGLWRGVWLHFALACASAVLWIQAKLLFSPLLIGVVSALHFKNPHASGNVFSHVTAQGLFSFSLVSNLFFKISADLL